MLKTIEQILSENVIRRRKSLGISQASLAELAKIAIATVNRLEKMHQIPQASNLEAIAKVLGTTRDELFKDIAGSPTVESLLKIIERQEQDIEDLKDKTSSNVFVNKLFKTVPIDILNSLTTSNPSWDAVRSALGIKPKKN